MKRGSVSSMAIGLLIVGLLVGAAGGYFVSTSSIQPQMDDLETQVSSLNSEKATLDTEVSALEGKISDLVSQVSELNTQVVKLNSEKSSIEAQLSTAQAKIDEKENEISSLQDTVAEYEAQIKDLETQLDMKDMMDSDGDGVPDYLETNGYYYKDGKFWLWDGDPNITYYCTDPTQPSTDQDPYSDGMEVSGLKMDTSVVAPGNHPLVPAYPDIYMSMDEFSVIAIQDITTSGGTKRETGWVNQVTDETTTEQNWNIEGSYTQKFFPGGAEVTVTAAYGEKYGSKHSVTSSESVLSSKEWNEATTVNPARAANIEFSLIFVNRGTATAQNIRPKVNMKLGGHSFSTFTFPEDLIINTLAVDARAEINVGKTSFEWEPGQEISLTLDELKLIQQGVPIFLDLSEIDADVVMQGEEGGWPVVDTWDHYKARIDSVCARISVDLGDGNMKDYRVYARRLGDGPVVTLREALEWTVGCEETSSGIEIMGTKVDDWRIGFSGENAFDDVAAQLAERNILDVVLDAKWTITIKAPTGQDIPQIVWTDSYRDYKTTLVKAAVVDDYAVSKVLFKASPEAEGQEMVTGNYSSVYYLALASDYTVTGEEIIEATNDRGNSITELVEVARKAPIADGFYVITSVNSNKVLDIEGTIEEGRNVIQYNFAGIDTQEWYVQHVSHGYYRIMDKTEVMCLEVVEGGVNVQINTWQNTDNQRWVLDAVGDGSYVILANRSDKCLDIDGSSQDNRASAIQNTTGDSASQRWILQPADSYPAVMPVRGTLEEHFIILNKGQGTCLDVKSESIDDGADVWQYSWWGGNNQMWELIPVGDGYFRIRAKHSGLCLTIENDTLIQQYYHGTDGQKWRIIGHEDESNPDDFYYEIENKDSQICLNATKLGEVTQESYKGNDNQKWQLIPVECYSWMNNIEVTWGSDPSGGGPPDGEGWTQVGGDLNEGAGGDFIYLWVRGPNTDNIAVTTGPIPAGEGWTQVGGDLNQGARGAFIYLWVRGPATGNIAVTTETYLYWRGHFASAPAGEGWNQVGCDLNKGTRVHENCIYLWIR